MEIPGLTRLKSPAQGSESSVPAGSLSTTAEHASQDTARTSAQLGPPPTTPKIDATLAARIEAMRASIKQKSALQEPEAANRVAVPTSAVNYNILDQALASHGFEAMPDSDEEIEMHQKTADSDDEDDSSSESSTSSGSDSDGSDDSMEEVAPLTAEERERILIAADDNDGPVSNEVPRTKNEIADEEEPIKMPDFEIDAWEPIEALGTITSIVGSTCVVNGTPTPETKVLDIGSLLVFDDRKNLGFIADTFGPVILPMFTVRFASADQLLAAGVTLGRTVYVVPKHAVYVFSETLRVKGTDASNIHDEEQSETEFSDDEQEALYKSQKKQQRKAEKQGTVPQQQFSRPLNDLESIAMAQGLTYDPSSNRVQPQQGHERAHEQRPQGYHAGPSRGQRGRGNNRGGRGTRGRPETNNYGRGPHGNGPSFGFTSTAQPFQRAFYQPDPAMAQVEHHVPSQSTDNARQLPQQADPSISNAPARVLYQPLKRPI